MANSLLIEKETGGYFGFTLTIDSIVQDKVRNMRNDAFAIDNLVHFKTANGANIVKKQNISVFDVTLIASGTFTFTNIDTFFAKLIEVGYWDWLSSGSGSGSDRFDELLDTFDYFGNNMKGVRVNESEMKLEPFTIYNYRKITELEDTFSSIIPNKMLATSSDGLKVELRDLPKPPITYLNALGTFHYSDLTTQTIPIAVTSGVEIKLTNDTEGANTVITNAPYGVSSVWNSTSNQFDFSQLSVGDVVHFRPDLSIDLVGTNTSYKLYMKMAIGGVAPWTLNIHNGERKATTEFNENLFVGFDISSDDTKNFPSELWVLTDSGANIKVNGWYFEILRKNVNIVNIEVSDTITEYEELFTYTTGAQTFTIPLDLKIMSVTLNDGRVLKKTTEWTRSGAVITIIYALYSGDTIYITGFN